MVDRDALVVENVEWALRQARKWRASIAPDDVEGVALEALVEAATKWRPDGGAVFRHYAKLIIAGRIRDAFRAGDTATRWERDQEASGAGKVPTRRLTPGPLLALAKQAGRMGANDDWVFKYDRAHLSQPPAQEDIVDARRALERMAALPERLQRVVALRAQGWGLAEIGRELGVTESRACQMLKEALALL